MLVLLAVLFCCTSLRCISYNIAICTLMAVLLFTTINLITELYNNKQATISVIICCVVMIIFKGLSPQYIVLSSAIIIASYLSTNIFKILRITMPFFISNFISVIIASLVDTSIICIDLLNSFSTNTVLSVYFKLFLFKVFYAAAITVCTSALLSIVLSIKSANTTNQGKMKHLHNKI